MPVACSLGSSAYDELSRHGYYAYAVPDTVLTQREWTLQTPFKSESHLWDVHCGLGASAPENPLILYYQDELGDLQLTIRISSLGSMWNHNNPTETVTLNTPWVNEDEGIVYQGQPLSPIKFEDIFGNKVIVRGKQPVSQKIDLITQLEYVGTPIEDVVNPWSLEWCESN
jgi:hypothetical protein